MQNAIILSVFVLPLLLGVSGEVSSPQNCTCIPTNLNTELKNGQNRDIWCRIYVFEPENFADVPETASLRIMSKNKIVFMDDSLPKVKELVFAGKAEIAANAWRKSADFLTSLHLSKVKLIDASESFKMLTALDRLEIEETTLKGLSVDSFDQIAETLTYLHLMYLKKEDFPVCIHKLTKLRYILLNKCELSLLPETLPNSVRYIHLKSMEVSELPFVEGLSSLRLTNCSISKITTQILRQYNNLEELAVLNNGPKVLEIETNAFENMNELIQIDLTGTHFIASEDTFKSLKKEYKLLVDPQYHCLCEKLNTVKVTCITSKNKRK